MTIIDIIRRTLRGGSRIGSGDIPKSSAEGLPEIQVRGRAPVEATKQIVKKKVGEKAAVEITKKGAKDAAYKAEQFLIEKGKFGLRRAVAGIGSAWGAIVSTVEGFGATVGLGATGTAMAVLAIGLLISGGIICYQGENSCGKDLSEFGQKAASIPSGLWSLIKGGDSGEQFITREEQKSRAELLTKKGDTEGENLPIMEQVTKQESKSLGLVANANSKLFEFDPIIPKDEKVTPVSEFEGEGEDLPFPNIDDYDNIYDLAKACLEGRTYEFANIDCREVIRDKIDDIGNKWETCMDECAASTGLKPTDPHCVDEPNCGKWRPIYSALYAGFSDPNSARDKAETEWEESLSKKKDVLEVAKTPKDKIDNYYDYFLEKFGDEDKAKALAKVAEELDEEYDSIKEMCVNGVTLPCTAILKYKQDEINKRITEYNQKQNDLRQGKLPIERAKSGFFTKVNDFIKNPFELISTFRGKGDGVQISTGVPDKEPTEEEKTEEKPTEVAEKTEEPKEGNAITRFFRRLFGGGEEPEEVLQSGTPYEETSISSTGDYDYDSYETFGESEGGITEGRADTQPGPSTIEDISKGQEKPEEKLEDGEAEEVPEGCIEGFFSTAEFLEKCIDSEGKYVGQPKEVGDIGDIAKDIKDIKDKLDDDDDQTAPSPGKKEDFPPPEPDETEEPATTVTGEKSTLRKVGETVAVTGGLSVGIYVLMQLLGMLKAMKRFDDPGNVTAVAGVRG